MADLSFMTDLTWINDLMFMTCLPYTPDPICTVRGRVEICILYHELMC